MGTPIKSAKDKSVWSFTTGNPFLGTKLLGFSIERGSGALKGLRAVESAFSAYTKTYQVYIIPLLIQTRALWVCFGLVTGRSKIGVPTGIKQITNYLVCLAILCLFFTVYTYVLLCMFAYPVFPFYRVYTYILPC